MGKKFHHILVELRAIASSVKFSNSVTSLGGFFKPKQRRKDSDRSKKSKKIFFLAIRIS